MSRYFEAHGKRKTQDLNGFWQFQTDPEDRGVTECWFCGLPAGDTVSVPSMWNNESGLLGYEGVAWYRREFVTEGGCLRFCFDGVMTEAEVWLDETPIGSHYGGFTQFDLIVPGVGAGRHALTVRVDNRFDAYSIPQKKVDWYHYGGIHRDVRIETLRGICVLNNELHYTLNAERDSIRAHFELELYNAAAEMVSSPLTAQLGDETVLRGTVTLEAGEHITWKTPDFRVNDIHLWDTDDPYLYPIALETETDGLTDRTGFRTVEVKDGQVLLNDRPIELRGVNRHEEHPDWGFAFPPKLMRKDLDIICDLGCNTVRGSHYPNSQIFVDMLDARGLLFWSEIPIWGCGFATETLGDPAVVERGLAMHREMVKYYYNHPSIILWGMHNEINSDTPEGYEMSKTYYRFLKEYGGNRIVTYASHKPMTDICLEFCDLICINLYLGWYSGKIADWDNFLDNFRARREALGMSAKPVVISEFGAAALYGQHTFDCVPWTEEYQAELFTHCIELFHRDPMVVGCYIWQFSDIRTCPEMGLNRARGFNNKGIVNEYRKPKVAFGAIRTLFHRYAEEEKTWKH